MKKLFEKVSLKIFILIITFCSTLFVCFLMFFFIRNIDKSYSNLLDKEIGARTLIQSIFTKRLNNYSNVYKIDKTENIDTIEKYAVEWEKLTADITSDFVKLKEFVPKDSIKLSANLDDILVKRNTMIEYTKGILKREKKNPSIDIMDNVNANYVNEYNESINSFLNNYNDYLINTSKMLTQHTLHKSNIYIAILPVPMILIFLFFGHILILFLRDFSLDE